MQVICYVHGTPFPKESCHEHHKSPRALGGQDDKGNLVYLCANCHTLVHRCAQLFIGNKSGIAADIASQAYPTPASRSRFFELVKTIMSSVAEAEDLDLGREKAIIILSLDHSTHSKLKTLAGERKENGRKVGVSRYIEAVLLQHIQKKGL